jgi:predicted lysophospholipase L1 biosynthesis ABC-type transport system permease subunit
MQKNSPQADIEAIRSIMERSTKFLSLSGLAGVVAGVYALIGGGVIRYTLDIRPEQFTIHGYMSDDFRLMIVMGLLILFISLLTAVVFTRIKAKANKEVEYFFTQIYNACGDAINGWRFDDACITQICLC